MKTKHVFLVLLLICGAMFGTYKYVQSDIDLQIIGYQTKIKALNASVDSLNIVADSLVADIEIKDVKIDSVQKIITVLDSTIKIIDSDYDERIQAINSNTVQTDILEVISYIKQYENKHNE